ncbi:MAG: DUF4340 domain-containing protein [Planctomycetes bacterium]|nr:DUF4340 domain-containing protein [Planctomycetota bacterium]
MNIKTTLIVLLIAVALAVYFIVVEPKTTTTQQREEQASQQPAESGTLLLAADAFPADKIKTIRIDKPGQPQVVIEKIGEDWTQTAPVRFKLQSWQVKPFVDQAKALRYTSTFKPADRSVKLDTLGLDSPLAKITYEGDGFKPVTLTLGSRAAAGRAYLTTDTPSETALVYVVDDALHQTAQQKNVRDMRDRSLASFEPGQARRIELKRDDLDLTLMERDTRWVITSPVTGRADRDKANNLIRALTSASVSDFVADNPANLAAFGLDKPAIELAVDVANPAPAPAPDAGKKDEKTPAKPAQTVTTHVLKIGAPTDLGKTKYFAMLDDVPAVFSLGKADVDKLNVKVDDVRDPKLTSALIDDAREITIKTGDNTLHMIKNPAWAFADPKPPYELDGQRMSELLDALFKTQAASFVDLSTVKLKEPVAEVTLALLAKTEPQTLKLYDHGSDQLLVVLGSETTGYVVPRADLKDLFEPALSFRERTVLDLNPDAIAKLTLTRSGEFPAKYELTRAAPKDKEKVGDWKLDGLDEQAVMNVIDMLHPLHAEAFLPESAVTKPEAAVLDIELADGTRYVLTVHPDSHIASLNAVDEPFKVSDDVAAAVAAELRDPLVLNLDIDKLAKVTSGPAIIRRDADGKYTISGDDKVTEKIAAGLFDELAGLRADHFVDAAPAGDPVATLTITTTDDKSQTLKVWSADNRVTAQLGDKVFTLPHDALLPLTLKEKPAPPKLPRSLPNLPGLPHGLPPGILPPQ